MRLLSTLLDQICPVCSRAESFMANLPPLSLPLPPSLSNPFNHHSQSLSAGLSQAGPAVLLSSEGLKLNRPTLEAQGNPHFYALRTSLLGEASDTSQIVSIFFKWITFPWTFIQKCCNSVQYLRSLLRVGRLQQLKKNLFKEPHRNSNSHVF